MFTYYNHIRMNTILTKYYDLINDELFRVCPIGQWLEASEALRKEWDDAIRSGHTSLGMTDEEFYEFLKNLENDKAVEAQFIAGFEAGFVKSFNESFTNLKVIG